MLQTAASSASISQDTESKPKKKKKKKLLMDTNISPVRERTMKGDLLSVEDDAMEEP